MAQSHEEMIKEFAKLAGNLSGSNAKQNKWFAFGRKLGVFVGKNAVALALIGGLGVLGWLFLNTLNELGLIAWSPTLWQAIKLVCVPVLFLVAVPVTLHVKLKQ